jgi:transcriptional regulator with XRE-family HTH domain
VVVDSATNVTIGLRLRRIREARGKSQEVIAGLAGITPSYLSLLESGKRALNGYSLIVALAKALDISPSELIGVPVAAPGMGAPIPLCGRCVVR